MDRPASENRLGTIHVAQRHNASWQAGKTGNTHVVPPTTELPQQMNSYGETREHPVYVGRSYHGRQSMSIVKKSKFLITGKLYLQVRTRLQIILRLSCCVPLPALRFLMLQTFQEFGEMLLPDGGLEKGVMAARIVGKRQQHEFPVFHFLDFLLRDAELRR